MVPLYAARIEDLGPGDFVRVECAACGHDVLITRSALLQGLRLQPTDRVLDLEPRVRCRECDARGKAVVSVRWAASQGDGN
jgi:ribosomal protein S27E